MGRVLRGAGIYPVSPSGHLLLAKRSKRTDHGGSWAGFGGAREPGETYEQCALRELFEETGYSGPMWLYKLAPHRFLGLVPYEFTPRLNWEHTKAAWFTLTEACGLNPLHWGLQKLLNNPEATYIIASMER